MAVRSSAMQFSPHPLASTPHHAPHSCPFGPHCGDDGHADCRPGSPRAVGGAVPVGARLSRGRLHRHLWPRRQRGRRARTLAARACRQGQALLLQRDERTLLAREPRRQLLQAGGGHGRGRQQDRLQRRHAHRRHGDDARLGWQRASGLAQPGRLHRLDGHQVRRRHYGLRGHLRCQVRQGRSFRRNDVTDIVSLLLPSLQPRCRLRCLRCGRARKVRMDAVVRACRLFAN